MRHGWMARLEQAALAQKDEAAMVRTIRWHERLASPIIEAMPSHQDVACAAVSRLDSSPEADVARLQAEVSTLRADNQRAECMASIQRDAVQLALDLLVTHPDLRGFFRMFTKRLRDDSGAHACGVWLLDESTNACELWMANVGGETLMAESPGWSSIALPRESMTRHLTGCDD